MGCMFSPHLPMHFFDDVLKRVLTPYWFVILRLTFFLRRRFGLSTESPCFLIAILSVCVFLDSHSFSSHVIKEVLVSLLLINFTRITESWLILHHTLQKHPKTCSPDNSKGAFGFWGQNVLLAFHSTMANDGATCCSWWMTPAWQQQIYHQKSRQCRVEGLAHEVMRLHEELHSGVDPMVAKGGKVHARPTTPQEVTLEPPDRACRDIRNLKCCFEAWPSTNSKPVFCFSTSSTPACWFRNVCGSQVAGFPCQL